MGRFDRGEPIERCPDVRLGLRDGIWFDGALGTNYALGTQFGGRASTLAVARCKPTATFLLGKPRGRSCCVAASKQKQLCREIKSPWEMGPQRASVKAEQLRSAKAPQILFASALASGC